MFDVDCKDLCVREFRGYYRVDGLFIGILFGMGKLLKYLVLFEDCFCFCYVITRDIAVIVSNALFDALIDLWVVVGVMLYLCSLWFGEMCTCWCLLVMFTVF